MAGGIGGVSRPLRAPLPAPRAANVGEARDLARLLTAEVPQARGGWRWAVSGGGGGGGACGRCSSSSRKARGTTTACSPRDRRLVDETLGEDDGVLTIEGSDISSAAALAEVARQWCADDREDRQPPGGGLPRATPVGAATRYSTAACTCPRAGSRRRMTAGRPAYPVTTTFQTKTQLAAALVATARQDGDLRALADLRRVVGGTRSSWMGWRRRDSGTGGGGARYSRSGRWSNLPPWPPRARPQRWVLPRAASGKGRRPGREAAAPRQPAAAAPGRRRRAAAARRPAALPHPGGAPGAAGRGLAALRAVATRDGLPGTEVWVLLRRPVTDDPAAEVKHYLVQRAADTALAAWCASTARRWPIESRFEEGKGNSVWTTTSCVSGAAGTTT